ncbi:MAG: zinc dependent phospholipase C family protein [Nanoarchaeota archaeon]
MRLFIILLLCIPSVYAWDSNGHKAIVDYIYFNTDMYSKGFNLSRLEEGSVAPDKVFKDQKKHHYPSSYDLANKWLNNSDDYSFGVASHYISDSFDATEYINNENSKDRKLFYSKAVIDIECRNYGYSLSELKEGSKNYIEWNSWLKNKSNAIPVKEINQATKVSLSIALKKYNLTCLKRTDVQDFDYFRNNVIYEMIALFILSVIFLYLFNS